MIRLRRFTLLLTLAALVAATRSPRRRPRPRSARCRSASSGRSLPPELSSVTDADAVLTQQMALMARSGVECVRITTWAGIELGSPRTGSSTRRTSTRQRAAGQRLTGCRCSPTYCDAALGVVAPEGAEVLAGTPPKDPQAYAALMRQLVPRYGPRGTFWAANPDLPRGADPPVADLERAEGALALDASGPGRRATRRLLKAAYQVDPQADRGATVVAGSFVGGAGLQPVGGVKRPLPAPAPSATSTRSRCIRSRTTRSRFGPDDRPDARDRRGACAARCARRRRRSQADHPDRADAGPRRSARCRRRRCSGSRRPPSGQRARMKAALQAARDQIRRKLRITQAYWFTWATQYDRQVRLRTCPSATRG